MTEQDLLLRIRAIVDGAKNVEGLSADLAKLGAQAGKPLADPTAKLQPELKKTSGLAGELASQLGALATAGSVALFVKESLAAMQKAEAGFRGLESVSKYTGVSIGESFGTASRLASDGLMTVADASKALQNLLSRGYDLKQAEDTILRLKDAAAFNRQASLSMTDAVLTATEGLKNENSILVDNAGVTKNVSKMWEEYAQKMGVTRDSLTQAQKVQAEYNGVMRETEAQIGNAAKAAGGLGGSYAKLDQTVQNLKVSFGGDLGPAAQLTADILNWLALRVQDVGIGMNAWGFAIGATVKSLGDIREAVNNLNFAGLGERIARNWAQAEEMASEAEDRYRHGLTPAMQEATQAAQGQGTAVAAASKLAADAEAALTATLLANGEKLKLSTKLLEEHHARQTASLAAALLLRLALIDASDANETVKAQQRALAETATNLAKLAEVRRYEAQRLDAINAAYTAEMAQAAQGESQKKQLALATVEARKAAYGDLAKAYAAVVDDLQGQWQREMQLFQAGTEGLKTLTLNHEATILEIRRMAMTEREKLKSQELERDTAMAKYKAEAAKGEQADEKELNRLFGEAYKLTTDIGKAKIERASAGGDKRLEEQRLEGALNGLLDTQKGALEKIGQQHKTNADALLPSLDEARAKLTDMNTALEALDRQLAQAKSLKLEIDPASLTAAQSVIAGLVAPETKTITIQTVAAGAEPAPAEGRRFGGIIAALARGGALAGYGGGDQVPALLEAGEFVVRKEAVSQYGPGLFAQLNARKFASGGPMDTAAFDKQLNETLNDTATLLALEAIGHDSPGLTPTGKTREGLETDKPMEQIRKRFQALKDLIDAAPADQRDAMRKKVRDAALLNQREREDTFKTQLKNPERIGFAGTWAANYDQQIRKYKELAADFAPKPDLKTAVSTHLDNAMSAIPTAGAGLPVGRQGAAGSPTIGASSPSSTIRLELALPNGTVVPADVPSRFEQDLRAVKRQMRVT